MQEINMPTAHLEDDALVKIEDGFVITWAECKGRAKAMTVNPDMKDLITIKNAEGKVVFGIDINGQPFGDAADATEAARIFSNELSKMVVKNEK